MTFFAAALNIKEGLKFEPTNADIYGRLGVVYFRLRHYEGSIYSLQCATYGCSGEDYCLGRGWDQCYPDLNENPTEIKGLAIDPDTIVYYYTYGLVLAALSRPRDNKCDKAMQVFGDVREELAANPAAYEDGYETIMQIIGDGEFICNSLADGSGPVPTMLQPHRPIIHSRYSSAGKM